MDAAAPQARDAALSAAHAALDAELARIDERFALTLRACAHGGHVALGAFCAALRTCVDGRAEAPALALVEALEDGEAASRAVRAAAWTMVAQRVAAAAPWSFHELLAHARAAMPCDATVYERMQTLAALTACAATTAEADTRDGQRMQFSRESLEHVIAAATGTRPARQELLHAIASWMAAFLAGIKASVAWLAAEPAAAELRR